MEHDLTKKTENVDLEIKRSFTTRRELMGIPSHYFIGAVMLAVIGVFVLINYLGFLLGATVSVFYVAVVIVPVFLVHKNDPEGATTALQGLLSPDAYDPARVVRRSVKLVRLGGMGPSVVSLNLRKVA